MRLTVDFFLDLTLKGNSMIENHIENLKAPLPNPCNIFEELPVGIKSKNPMMDEYPPGTIFKYKNNIKD